LHHHRGTFWLWNSSHYVQAPSEMIRKAAWTYLENAHRIADKRPIPFKPKSSIISDALDALSAVCHLDNRIEPPAWLDAADDWPAAGEMFPVANGLLHLPSGELYPLTPNYFGLAASTVEFNPEASAPSQWLQFLDQIFPEDQEAKDTLQDWF